MERNYRKQNRIFHTLALASAALLAAAVFVVALIMGSVDVSADPPEWSLKGGEALQSGTAPTTVTINSLNDLINYSREYALGGHSPDDTLNFSLASGTAFDLPSEEGGFVSIGKGIGGAADRPFNGSITFGGGAIKVFLLDRPLFYKITTDATISEEITICRKSAAADDATGEALFAETVVAGATNSGSNVWRVAEDFNDEITNNCVTASVINVIEANAKVSVEFTDNAKYGSYKTNVRAAGNVGLICGTAGADSELTVKINAGTNDAFEIKSTANGHAGGIVGQMDDGAKLIFDYDYASDSGVTITAAGANCFAGGLVGHATDSEIVFGAHTATVSNTVSGGTGAGGAGGMFGYFSSSKNNLGAAGARTFELENFETDSSFTISGGKNCGGVIGKLYATNDITIQDSGDTVGSGDFTRQMNFTGGTYRGGLVGVYQANSLERTLEISDVKVKTLTNSGSSTASGGAIGCIDNSKAAYILVNGFELSANNKLNGGVVGDMQNKGSFVDICGTTKISGSVDAGLVHKQNYGVVRVQGTTDLSGASTTNQLITTRGHGLVYALGSGSDSGWTLERPSDGYDDIGDWGEVQRLCGSNGLVESDFFTVDSSAHTVTVAAPVPVGSSATAQKDFIKTALNIQHNVTEQSNAAGGALCFEGATKSHVILQGTISIAADVDLTNTGIISLTRDNGANAPFKGTFNGNGHTVKLAIGETYGKVGGAAKTEADIGDNNYGTTFNHKYLGLFAKATGAASFTGVTLDGFISMSTSAVDNSFYVGGLAAIITKDVGVSGSISNVTTGENIKLYFKNGGNSLLYCGGAVGAVESGATGELTVTHSVSSGAVAEKRLTNKNSYIGGAIGAVLTTGDFDMDFDTVTVGGTYNNNNIGGNSYNGVHYGGLICNIASKDGDLARELTLKNITVANTVNIETKITSGSERTVGAGGFLGCGWFDVDVTIGTEGSSDGVTVGEAGTGTPTITVPEGSTNANIGALVYKSTGHWTVNHVDVVKANISSAVNSTFGFLVNDGLNGTSSALYLELYGPGYNVAETSFTNSGTSTFDEIVAFTHVNGKGIDDNGEAIVSIRIGASGVPITMTGSACNTYQNQTSYGQNTVTNNPHARYYYNLDVIRAKNIGDTPGSLTPAERLLLWSLKQYAHPKITAKGYFNNGFSDTIEGDCDMYGLSYYPVNASGMTISNATVKFYNQEIESGESGTGNSDGVERLTRATGAAQTQHYLMHEGIFLDHTENLTVNGLTLKGNVSNIGDESGFLVRRTLGDRADIDTVSISNVTLAGAEITNRNSGDYSPLLINKIGKNVTFTLTGVSAVAGSGDDEYPSSTSAVASSLIGDVGDASATNINLVFSDIRLDARTANDPSSLTAYGTSRSIFDCATLLNSFRYLNGGSAEYNYTHTEDWTGSQHHVTYGKEIKDSEEYAGREDHYYDDAVHYTHPTDSTGASAFNFSSGFLPYVYREYNYNSDSTYHEIKVNVKDVNVVDGCGQYNDPYQITDGGQLATVSKIIYGTPDVRIEVTLPSDLGTHDMWCTDKNSHDVYVFNGTNFVRKSDGTGSKTVDTVREYLAGAYYQIVGEDGGITLPQNYNSLGKVSDASSSSFDCPYAFRGVIVGSGAVTITNPSPNPLIKSANGCVVKDVTVSVSATVTISQDTNKPFSYDDAGCASYGAVIGQVMGGDNIIDHVTVNFTSATFANEYNQNTNYKYTRLVPVGGYVGVIVNGGVIFRNMGNSAVAGLTNAKCNLVNNAAWLYVNPIIGRVIEGYAFNERAAYAASSSVLNNGTKNYAICDVNAGEESLLDVQAGNAVSIPNSQAFYILSCIVNTGAGSASAYNADYNSITGVWNAYRSNTSTRCASYDDVGTSADSSVDYAVVAAQDVYSGSNKTPYIIRKYTTDDTDRYYARCLCSGGRTAQTITLAESGSYSLGANFRGIGGKYFSENTLNLRFSSFNGNNSTVTLSMMLKEYDFSGNGTTTRNDENYNEAENPGFGLFNKLCQNVSSSSDEIKDLTITGTVTHEPLKLTGGTISGKIKDNTVDGVASNRVVSVGGLGGYSANSFNLNNVKMNNLTVTSAKYGGGLVGYAKDATFNIKNCSTGEEGVSVTAKVKAGGMIGYVSGASAVLNITQTDASKKFVLNEIQTTFKSGTKGDYYDDQYYLNYYTAGGLVGTVECGNTSAVTNVTIQNVKVEGKSGNDKHVFTPADSCDHRDVAGGIVGSMLNTDYTIEGVSVSNVSIYGCVAGGIVGFDGFKSTIAKNTDDFSGVDHIILNSIVDGGSKENTKIKAPRMAGGLVGEICRAKTASSTKTKSGFTLSGDQVRNLTVCSEWHAGISGSSGWEDDSAVGTAVGGIRNLIDNSGGGYCRVNLSDYIASDCYVYTFFTKSSHPTEDRKVSESGTGGIIGSIAGTTSLTSARYPSDFYGHNILCNNLYIKNYNQKESAPVNNARTTGLVCGNNFTNGVIRIVGITFQKTNLSEIRHISGKMAGGDTVSDNYFGTDGYVIMADYAGASIECVAQVASGGAVENPTYYVLGTDYDYVPSSAAPFVPVASSNCNYVGSSGLVLTGDGISDTVNGLPIGDIISAGGARYGVAKGLYGSKTIGDFTRSLYNTEQNTSHPNDFAVLVIEDINKANTTALINAYLGLLTNTNVNYANDTEVAALNATVSVNRLVFEDGSFVKKVNSGETAANLIRDTSLKQFYMNINNVDTAGDMFTLIDVAFKDPADTSKIAYHLYVPVLVKKMLTFTFEIATGSGTIYKSAWYDDPNGDGNVSDERWGKAVMENLGTPASLYFRITYKRDSSDWTNAANSGDNMQRNYDKKLMVGGDTSNLSGLDDAILVLVDPQRGGKPYYGRFADVYHDGYLDLQRFQEDIILSAGVYVGSGAYFDPVNFSDMLEITATPAGTGDAGSGAMVECDAVSATVSIGGTYYRPYNASTDSEEKMGGTKIARYDLSVSNGDVEESYYISFFTEAGGSNVLYHPVFTGVSSFGVSSYPSRIEDASQVTTGNGTAHMLLGNIFVHTGYSIAATTENLEMTTENNTLGVVQSSAVKIHDALKDEVKGYLGATSPIQVYQSFLVRLTKKDESGTKNIIDGSPTAYGTYTVAAVNSAEVASVSGSYSPGNIDCNNNYAEYTTGLSLNRYLVQGNGVIITGNMSLRYESDENIAQQFPEKSDPSDTSIGVTVSGSSNIAFSPDRTAFSQCFESGTDARYLYYSRAAGKRANLYYNVTNDEYGGDYGQLGINPIDDTDGRTVVPISTIATLDISEIYGEADGYDLIMLTVQLSSRQASYSDNLTLLDYLGDVWLSYGDSDKGSDPDNCPDTTSGTMFTFVFPRSWAVRRGGETELQMPIDFTVKTGNLLEDASHFYSNYKVSISAKLVRSDGGGGYLDLEPSYDTNFIVYTNARIITDFIG